MATSKQSVTLVKTLDKEVDVLVVGLVETAKGPELVGLPTDLESSIRKRFGSSVMELALDLGAKTEPAHVTFLPTADHQLVVVGLGEVDVTPEQVRRSTAAAIRAVISRSKDPVQVAVSLETTDPEMIKAAAEGALLGGYQFRKVSDSENPARLGGVRIVSESTKSESRRAAEIGAVVAEAVCTARDWVNTPPNLLYPESFAEAAKEQVKDTKIDVEILDDKALRKNGYGGLTAVGGGSARGPRLVRFDYHPRGAKFHLALVGKGITFDSGGLDIKPADGMYTMKCDMGGAAAVLAATKAIAELGLSVHVTCYAAMAENMPSGDAYRPSDVLTIYGGTTVENGNTDAEGRLVLVDAIARACEDEPDMIVDVATLTGACMVALGKRIAGLMASDDHTADVVLDAAELAGEDFWQLPIPQHIDDDLDSDVADVKSTGPRQGGALVAAAFLRRFVADDIPWAHLDIAGPAFNDSKPYDHVPKGGTGVAVRTLVALGASLQN